MKAKRTTNRNRILTTVGLLVFTISLGYSQGLLAQGAMKLFKIQKPVAEINVPQFTFVDYKTESEDSFNLKNFVKEVIEEEMSYEVIVNEIAEVNISKTIYVSAIELSYEADLITEDWMTTPLENNLEGNVVENWMSESFTESVEGNLTVEDWMIEPFTETVEEDLFAEDWMTQPLSESMESELETEDWMAVSFTESAEKELTVEDWMTQSLFSE